MKWLIMGGTGFTGQFIIKALKKTYPKDEIIVSDVRKKNISNVKEYNFDFRDFGRINSLLSKEEPNYIINLAGIFKSDDILLSVQINSVVLAHICEFYKRSPKSLQKLKNILVIGSSAQYGSLSSLSEFPTEDSICHPSSLYGWTKLLQEQLGLEYFNQFSIPISFTRTANLLGPGLSQQFVVPIILQQLISGTSDRSKRVVRLRNINAGRDFIDVRDAVSAYIKIVTSLKTIGQIYNIGSGKVTMLSEIISLAKDIIGLDDVEIIGKSSDIPDIHAINCSKIREDLKWEPKIALVNTLEDMIKNEMKKSLDA